MNAVELQLPGGAPSGVFACGKCGIISSGSHVRGTDTVIRERLQRLANECCAPPTCADCGKVREKNYYVVCDRCKEKRDAGREVERFEKAKKLTVEEWSASASADCFLLDDRCDKWFRDLDDAEEWYADDAERERSAYLWCTTPVKWKPDASGDIADRMHDHYSEDACEGISDAEYKRLDEFVNQWWEEQGVVSYEPDYSRCVLLPQKEPA